MEFLLSKDEQKSLRNGENLQYLTQLRTEIGANTAAYNLIKASRAMLDFDATLADMKKVFVQNQASALTALLENADGLRDGYMSGLILRCASESYSPTASVRDAAKLLRQHIGIYGDNIQAQNFNLETASITALLNDLNTKPALAAAMAAIGATGWLAPLAAANQQVDTLYRQRGTEAAGTELPYNMKEKREEMRPRYQKLGEKIAGYYSVLDGAAPWDSLVGVLTQLARKYRNLLAERAGGGGGGTPPDDGSAHEEPLP